MISRATEQQQTLIDETIRLDMRDSMTEFKLLSVVRCKCENKYSTEFTSLKRISTKVCLITCPAKPMKKVDGMMPGFVSRLSPICRLYSNLNTTRPLYVRTHYVQLLKTGVSWHITLS